MPDILYRWDEPTSAWVLVTSVNRIEVSGGGNSFKINDLPILVGSIKYNLVLTNTNIIV